jgi:hypothetical protein
VDGLNPAWRMAGGIWCFQVGMILEQRCGLYGQARNTAVTLLCRCYPRSGILILRRRRGPCSASALLALESRMLGVLGAVG